jgi:hypothetical protein
MGLLRELAASSVLVIAVVGAGCDVGEVPNGMTSNNKNDATSDAPMVNGDQCVDRGTPQTAHIHSATAGGGDKAGTDCMVAGCHTQGGGPAFTAAGTVYEQGDKTKPNPGVTIRIKFGPNNETVRTAVSDSAGNFRFEKPIEYPAKTDVTTCPDVVPMSTTLNQGDGACSRAGACHAPGSGQGVVYIQK